MARERPSPLLQLPTTPPDAVDDATWLDVIQKMDEVYSKLVHDEIELEEKNAQLEQSQQFIISLLSAMSDVLIACNQDGIIEETNAALCELVGRTEASLRGTPVLELLADNVSVQRMLQVAFQPGSREGMVLEVQLRGADGQAVEVDLNCTPRRDSTGRLVGRVLVGRPLGELKRAYRQLREAHEALQQAQQQLLHSEKMASLGRLVAGVAHELNNPISFVFGNMHVLQRYGTRLAQYLDAVHRTELPAPLQALRKELRVDPLMADLPSLVEGTLEGAQRTTDIVAGLKRFAAVAPEETGPVELNAVVERAIHWVQKGTAPGFAVHWQRGADCWVRGNEGQLLQVMMNLIQNAYDAACAVAGRSPALHITLEQDGAQARLRFADNGTGIAPEHLGRIFDPFFTTKEVGKGTGLGLSISYRLVEQHGGTLSAANRAQGGAEFSLGLPLAPQPQ
ncbi:MAG: sensor histidine kinase [Rhodoferax sp.]